jgi:hypothetical protein
MDVSSQEAQASLGLIEDTQARWRKAIGSSYAGDLLMLWGTIWIMGYVGLYFSHRIGGHLFAVLDVVGIGGTVVIARRWPIRSPETRAVFLGIGGVWLFLALYAVIWMVLLRPASGKEVGAFLCTVCMFAYVVIGLWFKSTFLIALGLTVTALVLVGFYLLSDYFYLWVALTGGGAVLGTGLYIRRWR